MSFVVDQIRRIDGQIDRVQLPAAGSLPSDSFDALSEDEAHDPAVTSRIEELQGLIKALSTSAIPKSPLLPVTTISALLNRARISAASIESQQEKETGYERELEWLLVSKATVQTYGQVVNKVLEQTIPLSEDIWYWDSVLGSYRYAGLYSIQTSPLRLWAWGKDVYRDVRARGGAVGDGWRQFYGLVKQVVRERSLVDIQKRAMSPLDRAKNEARDNKSALRRARHMNANALGVLLGEGLSNDCLHTSGLSTPDEAVSEQQHRAKWRATASKNIALMEAVLESLADPRVSSDNFDGEVAAWTQDDPFYDTQSESVDEPSANVNPSAACMRLQNVLLKLLPQHNASLQAITKKHGRPSIFIRYWLPASILLVSSSTVLRIVANRRAEILTWIREFGATVIDFWSNWVIEPVKKVIGTIRHDEASEVSIMSKRSLEGDRESLERMVVDFVVAHTEKGSLTDAQIAAVRVKVHEGDLTPVLRAYERDLQRPILGALTGNLIAALLIQIQKTKVDVEIAIGGIDSLLKSQELVFGFVGLTPGILVSIGVYRWLSDTFSNRKGSQRGTVQWQMVRTLCKVDKILTKATPNDYGELAYKDHGLLLCEVHLLRQTASTILPKEVFRAFVEEIDELLDIRTGIKQQHKAVRRIWCAYRRWL